MPLGRWLDERNVLKRWFHHSNPCRHENRRNDTILSFETLKNVFQGKRGEGPQRVKLGAHEILNVLAFAP